MVHRELLYDMNLDNNKYKNDTNAVSKEYILITSSNLSPSDFAKVPLVFELNGDANGVISFDATLELKCCSLVFCFDKARSTKQFLFSLVSYTVQQIKIDGK